MPERRFPVPFTSARSRFKWVMIVAPDVLASAGPHTPWVSAFVFV